MPGATSMNWEKLLSGTRFFWPRTLPQEERPSDDPILDVYQTDSSRITLSAPFHRLQRKTQVLPFPKTDYPRTRLTHTNEVSDCGRQIARIIARQLASNGKLAAERITNMEDVVAAACKGHDVGNPPFGHSGEFAIQRWVERNTAAAGRHAKSKDTVPILREQFRNELLSFDGNAQGFRLLTETTGWRKKGGLQLTCAVLGTFSKYPWTIDHSDTRKKKFGILNSSVDIAKNVFDECGMKIKASEDGSIRYCRHPLAYVLEAADDISYLTADLEDAVKSKVVGSKKAFEFLEGIAKDALSTRTDRRDLMHRAEQVSDGEESAKLRYLKDHAQRALKIAVSDIFLDKYDQIMEGEFDGDLIARTGCKNICIEIKDFFRNEVYDDIGKVRNEIFGARVIEGLLEFFFDTLFTASEDFERCAKTGEAVNEMVRKRLTLFPLDNYFPASEIDQTNVTATVADLSNEKMGQMVVDYVSGMTDSYATDIFQQLRGHQRPAVSW